MGLDSINNFKASWTEQNACLNPNSTIFYAIINKIKNVLLYLPNSLIATCINPRKATKFSDYDEKKSYGRSFTKQIITPDNIKLQARVDKIEGSNSETPTVILFNPLGTNDGIFYSLRQTLIEKQCNVVSFDYRGLGSTWREKDLFLDGDSVYQYVTKELNITASKVHFFGYSLGGAIAAQVKAIHPESQGKYIGDRPFSSIVSLISEKCCIRCLGFIIKKISSFVSRIFIAYPIYLVGWNLNTKKALEKMEGKKRIFYHPNDYLIPFEASAARYSTHRIIALDPSIKGPSTHFSPINCFKIDKTDLFIHEKCEKADVLAAELILEKC